MTLREPSTSQRRFPKSSKLKFMELESLRHVHPGVLIDDLETNFSIPHFRHVVAACRSTIADLPESDSSPMAEAKRRIILYADLQLQRVVRSPEMDNDLLAGILRNLMELREWAKFVASDEKQAERFVNESVIDTRELFDLIGAPVDPAIDALNAAAAHIQGKRKRFDRGSEQDDFFWKLCSKLIHPSSLVINNTHTLLQDSIIRKRLAVRVAHLGWLVVNETYNINFFDPTEQPGVAGGS